MSRIAIERWFPARDAGAGSPAHAEAKASEVRRRGHSPAPAGGVPARPESHDLWPPEIAGAPPA